MPTRLPLPSPFSDIVVITAPGYGVAYEVLGTVRVDADRSDVRDILDDLLDETRYAAYALGADTVTSFVYTITSLTDDDGDQRFYGTAMGTAVRTPVTASSDGE